MRECGGKYKYEQVKRECKVLAPLWREAGFRSWQNDSLRRSVRWTAISRVVYTARRCRPHSRRTVLQECQYYRIGNRDIAVNQCTSPLKFRYFFSSVDIDSVSQVLLLSHKLSAISGAEINRDKRSGIGHAEWDMPHLWYEELAGLLPWVEFTLRNLRCHEVLQIHWTQLLRCLHYFWKYCIKMNRLDLLRGCWMYPSMSWPTFESW